MPLYVVDTCLSVWGRFWKWMVLLSWPKSFCLKFSIFILTFHTEWDAVYGYPSSWQCNNDSVSTRVTAIIQVRTLPRGLCRSLLPWLTNMDSRLIHIHNRQLKCSGYAWDLSPQRSSRRTALCYAHKPQLQHLVSVGIARKVGMQNRLDAMTPWIPEISSFH